MLRRRRRCPVGLLPACASPQRGQSLLRPELHLTCSSVGLAPTLAAFAGSARILQAARGRRAHGHCAVAEGFHPHTHFTPYWHFTSTTLTVLVRASATWRRASPSSACPFLHQQLQLGVRHRGPPAALTSAAAACVPGANWNALSQGVSASRHASKGIHLPAQAMRA